MISDGLFLWLGILKYPQACIVQIAQSINLGNDTEISNNVSISNLANGIYMVKTTLGNQISIRKLIIE